METRREFMTKLALLPGAGAWAGLLASIDKAAAISPAPGSTFLDAEHVVILMQENRSFDHAFGSLRGVRGFNDPRAIALPNGNPIWVQTNDAGVSYAPFRLNIKETNATWMGSLPHSWTDQVDARNGGRCDRWLQAKPSGHDEYAHMPLTLGYYTREDIPFYYALADAFTICDQNFCSSLTGTTPNRLYLWTGTTRAEPKPGSWANVLNSDVTYESEVHWTTFPERLEEHGISWRIYQNELSIDSGLRDEADAWLGNFTDNPIEWFSQFGVRFAQRRRAFVEELPRRLMEEIAALEKQPGAEPSSTALADAIAVKKAALADAKKEQVRWSAANYQKLPERARKIHERAFTTNCNDPAYRELAELEYDDGDAKRKMVVPKGDVLHQFRSDVENDKLPTVSWLVAPERFSDHPGSAWYGAWYLSEVLEILTRRPEVWQKTVFILTYDENDGYFDHVPPFVPPHPTRPESGTVSAGIDPAIEYVELQQELTRKPPEDARESPIGLGYRVPMIIASPWSRGGCVCSQVFDHTSVLRFLEVLLSHKTGRAIEETNISQWRRTVCGDLTSAFRPAPNQGELTLPFHDRDDLLTVIHRTQFKPVPARFQQLATSEVEALRDSAAIVEVLPHQEAGTRPSAPLPYELDVNGKLSDDGRQFTIIFEARNKRFEKKSSGAPFIAYARHGGSDGQIRNYAVAAGDRLEDAWNLDKFEQGKYDIAVYGPNGFFRQFRGNAEKPKLEISLNEVSSPMDAHDKSAFIELRLSNLDHRNHVVTLTENAYGAPTMEREIPAGEQTKLIIDTGASERWYDLSVVVVGFPSFHHRYAGRIETGEWGSSDPAMGRLEGRCGNK
jgi:phospholipase C